MKTYVNARDITMPEVDYKQVKHFWPQLDEGLLNISCLATSSQLDEGLLNISCLATSSQLDEGLLNISCLLPRNIVSARQRSIKHFLPLASQHRLS